MVAAYDVEPVRVVEMNRTENELPAKPTLKSLARLFLLLGTTSFGGPAAHIGLLENEVVRRRKWLSAQEFLDLLGATNLIPGPNSTEMAIHIGHKLKGWRGLLVAGIAFIAPATAIVSLLSWAYVRFGTLPAIHGALYGIKPVMIGIIAHALWTLGRSCLRTRVLIAICLVDVVAITYGVHELVILFGTGLASCLIASAIRKSSCTFALLPFSMNVQPLLAFSQPLIPQSFSLDSLFLVFLKIGSVLFGSGYVLFAYMKADFVDRLGWMTDRQLLDAVTIGQITPGPLFTSATFVGYLMAGPIGGLVATVGIFLPSFVFVTLSAPLVPRMRRSTIAAAFLDGVNVASWVLMAAVTFSMGRESLVDSMTILLALFSLVLIAIWRVNSTWLVAIGAVSGIAATLY